VRYRSQAHVKLFRFLLGQPPRELMGPIARNIIAAEVSDQACDVAPFRISYRAFDPSIRHTAHRAPNQPRYGAVKRPSCSS
jgi:hypothetical protein